MSGRDFCHVIVRGIRASGSNALSAVNLAGGPAITAHVGFGDRLAHEQDMEFGGVAVLHQGFEHEGSKAYGILSPSKVRGAAQPRGRGDGGGIELSDQPWSVGFYRASLVIRLSGDSEKLQKDIESGRLKERMLVKWRLAGGQIEEIRDVSFEVSAKEAFKDLRRESGFWVLDRKDLIESQMDGDGSQLDAMMAALYRREDRDEPDKKAWLSASCCGYLRVSEYAFRSGTRMTIDRATGEAYELMHAYAEPLLGLVEYRSKRAISDPLGEKLFWKIRKSEIDERAFVAVAGF